MLRVLQTLDCHLCNGSGHGQEWAKEREIPSYCGTKEFLIILEHCGVLVSQWRSMEVQEEAVAVSGLGKL